MRWAGWVHARQRRLGAKCAGFHRTGERAAVGAAPAIVNGASVPTIVSPGNDPTWCEGAYRADVGTNFGE